MEGEEERCVVGVDVSDPGDDSGEEVEFAEGGAEDPGEDVVEQEVGFEVLELRV